MFIEAVLCFFTNGLQKVLDVGTGTGIWAMYVLHHVSTRFLCGFDANDNRG